MLPTPSPGAAPAPDAAVARTVVDLSDRNPGNVLLKAVNGVKTLEGVGDIGGDMPLIAAVGGLQPLGRPADLRGDQLPMGQAVGDLNSGFRAPLRMDQFGSGPLGTAPVSGVADAAPGGAAVFGAAGTRVPMPVFAALQGDDDRLAEAWAAMTSPAHPAHPALAGLPGAAAGLDQALLAVLDGPAPLPQQLLAAGLRRQGEIDALARALG